MTDISKWKNVSLSRETCVKLDKLRKTLVPNLTLSLPQTINYLVNEKVGKLNGRVEK